MAPCERCVDLIGQEWAEGSQHLRNGGEALIERGVSGVVAGFPEAGPTPTYVPIRQVIDELRDSTGTAQGVEALKRCRDGRNRVVEFGKNPTIEHMCGRRRMRVGLPSIEIGIGGKERKHIPKREQGLACGFANAIRKHTTWCPRLSGGKEIPAKSVGAERVENIEWSDDIATRLRHLLTVLIDDERKTDNVLVRR